MYITDHKEHSYENAFSTLLHQSMTQALRWQCQVIVTQMLFVLRLQKSQTEAHATTVNRGVFLTLALVPNYETFKH